MSVRRVQLLTRAIQALYPKDLADSSWDNTGLLVDATLGPDKTHEKLRLLMSIDLTAKVCDEAIERDVDMVLAYHPLIFRGLKQLSPQDPQQKSILRLVTQGISVYSPHTAVDAARYGVTDWLASAFGPNVKISLLNENSGMGRRVDLQQELPLEECVRRVKSHLNLSTVQLVRPVSPKKIMSIGICAGSGSSVLRGCDADLWFTGELGHHEMLYLRESGVAAIVCGHSNTERGFLPILRQQLLNQLGEEKAEIDIAKEDYDPIEYV